MFDDSARQISFVDSKQTLFGVTSFFSHLIPILRSFLRFENGLIAAERTLTCLNQIMSLVYYLEHAVSFHGIASLTA